MLSPPPPSPYYYRLLINLFRVPAIREEEIIIFTAPHKNKMGGKKTQIKTIIKKITTYTQNLNDKKRPIPRFELATFGLADRRSTNTLSVQYKLWCISIVYNHDQFINTRF